MSDQETLREEMKSLQPGESENASIARILDGILEKRSERADNMDKTAAELEEKAIKVEKLKKAESLIEHLSDEDRVELFGSEDACSKFKTCMSSARECQRELREAAREYRALGVRFRRKTVNLGVIGKQGAGKSCLLQSLSGLKDDFIPSGDGPSCTGVTCVIENVPGQEEPEVYLTLKDYRTVEREIDRALQNLWSEITGTKDDCPRLSGKSWQEALKTAFQKMERELERRGIKNGDAYNDWKSSQSIYCDQFERWYALVYPSRPQRCGSDGEILPETAWQEKLKQWKSQMEQWAEQIRKYPLELLNEADWAQDGAPRCRLTNLNMVADYIAKRSVAVGRESEIYRVHCFHIAIREAHIRIAFTGIDARICLIDTVGIGDSSADTLDRMNRAIDVDSDGLIFLHRYPEPAREYAAAPEIAELAQICGERAAAQPGDWTAFLMNVPPKQDCGSKWIANYFDPSVRASMLVLEEDVPNLNKARSSAAALENYAKQLSDSAMGMGLFSDSDPNEDGRYIRLRYVADVGQPEIVKGFLNQFLKQISQRLSGIDGERMKGAEKKRATAEQAVRRLNHEFQTLRIPSGGYLDMISMRMDKKQTKLREELIDYYNQIENEGMESPLEICHKEILKLSENVSRLREIISGINKNYDHPRTLLRASEKLYQEVRAIASNASSAYEERERQFKEDIAAIFVEALGINLDRLGESELLKVTDEAFFKRMGELLFRDTAETEELQGFFQSVYRFHLNDSTIMAEAIVYHAAVKNLCTHMVRELQGAAGAAERSAGDGPHLRQPAGDRTRPGIRADVNMGPQQIEEVLRSQLKGLCDDINECLKVEKSYSIPPQDRLREETLNFMLCFGEPYEKTWLRVFSRMYEKGIILQGEMDDFRRIRNAGDQIRRYVSEFLGGAYGDIR